MTGLRYTLVSDGSSDRALIPILNWLLQQRVSQPIQSEWADLRRLKKPPRRLSDRIRSGLELYPCDVLFVHRDAEKESFETRTKEIHQSWKEVSENFQIKGMVCVVPVRMLEAWLLANERAIRLAAGNPHGRTPLSLPKLDELEKIPDPKSILHEQLLQASELSGRRRDSFQIPLKIHRIAEFIEDFSPLRTLPAFVSLEKDVAGFIKQHGLA